MGHGITEKLLAEMIGTAALVFVGAGVAALGFGGLIGVALAHGLVVASFGFAYGPISGAHLNPAVTIAVAVANRLHAADAVSYIVAQLLGAVIAAWALALLLEGAGTRLGMTELAGAVPVGATGQLVVTATHGLVFEAIGAFLLVNAVLHTAYADDGRFAGAMAPLAIGLTLVLVILLMGPLTGASVNPARSFGPAWHMDDFAELWIYAIGPIGGGVIAALLHRCILRRAATA